MTLSNSNAREKKGEAEYILVNRAAYDQLSQQYSERLTEKSKFETSASEIIDNILKFKDLSSESIILEVGPGSGEALAYFSQLKTQTFAVDISSKIIEVSRKTSPKTEFINANILNAKFPVAKFDVIFAGAIIHLFPKKDAQKLIDLICDWLKDSGILFINTTINPQSEEGYLIKQDYHGEVRRYRKKWIETEFQAFISRKFKILKTLYTNEVDRKKKWVGYICCKYGN